MKDDFNTTKVNILTAMHDYIEASIGTDTALDVKLCINYVIDKTGYSMDNVLRFLIVDYSLAAYDRVESIEDKEINAIKEAIKQKKG